MELDLKGWPKWCSKARDGDTSASEDLDCHAGHGGNLKRINQINYCSCWLAHTCLCAVTITNVSRHLCEEVTFT